MDRARFYRIVYPVLAIVYGIVIFLADLDTTVVVIGAMLLGAAALVGLLLPVPASRR